VRSIDMNQSANAMISTMNGYGYRHRAITAATMAATSIQTKLPLIQT
jgi:hypothetical protein